MLLRVKQVAPGRQSALLRPFRAHAVRDWEGIWAVRHDWPDGAHEFVLPRGTRALAVRALKSDRKFWRTAPVRPEFSVVRISLRDFELHARRGLCRAPDCPFATVEPGDGDADFAGCAW